MLNKNKLIFSQLFNEQMKSNPLILADVGARGELHDPWGSMNSDAIFTIGFEPDEVECDRLVSTGIQNRMYIPKALWSFDGKIDFHLASNAGNSSVYPPNMDLIKRYAKSHWESRVTARKLSLKCVTLDKILGEQKLDCDFLKLDTHSAGYEILKGAEDALDNKIFGVLIETWSAEVHKGQMLSGDILQFMSKKSFSLFDVNVAAAWRRENNEIPKLNGKAQIVGFDFLFFKDPYGFSDFNKVIKAAAIAEVYGFPDFALEILNEKIKQNPEDADLLKSVKSKIIHNSEVQGKFINKLKRKIGGFLGKRIENYPSLHY